jgi:hypothetical protein
MRRREFVHHLGLAVGLAAIRPGRALRAASTRAFVPFDVRDFGAAGDGSHLDTAANSYRAQNCLIVRPMG